MDTPSDKRKYKAQVKIGKEIVFSVDGDSMDDLRALISARCELERPGTEGKILDMNTGETVYSCRKQSVGE